VAFQTCPILFHAFLYFLASKDVADYEHMIKARAQKEGVRISKTPKKLASICCP
jgi:hypothetical protein